MTLIKTLTLGANLTTTRACILFASLGAGCGTMDGGVDGASGNDGAVGVDGNDMHDGAILTDARDGTAPADVLDTRDAGDPAMIPTVNLGMSGQYAILAMSGISTGPASAITGNIGVSPAAATYITGFSLMADSTNVFATSPQVTGHIFASDYAVPTPANLTTAIGDMQTAYTDAAGRAPNVTELGAGNIGGMTLSPGVYKWGTGLLIPTNVTLTGTATSVWIFQVAQDLTVSGATRIVLAGGAIPRNIFWQIAGSAEIGTTAQFEGSILSQTAITMRTGASITGRLLAQTAVSIQAATVVAP